MKRVFLLALPALVGCQAFDVEEAQKLAEANVKVGVTAYTAAWDDKQAEAGRATDAVLNWEESDGATDPDGDPMEGWSFDGSLSSDGPWWTGAITADGHLAFSDDYAEWAVGVGYDAVASSDFTVDGDMDWTWYVDLQPDGFMMEFTAQGEIAATGEVEGTGAVDYTATVEVSGRSAAFDVEGDIGGAPVDFSLTVNLPL